MAAASALMLTACTNEDATNESVVSNGAQAVAFDTYVPNATRTGDAGVQTTTTLQTAAKGFGVFATYSDDVDYATWKNGTNIIPNFMYNQHVTYSSPSWIYSPIKYWPNETTVDMLNASGHASSTATDKLSFFAYAPYVADFSTKVADTDNAAPTPNAIENVGITALTANTDKVDPFVTYQIAYTPSKSVDLLWGVAPSGGLTYTAVNNVDITKDEGLPLIDLVKPSKNQKIKFLFKHALARVGLKVVAAVDQIAPGGNLDSETKIFVNSVTIEDAAGNLATTADLNLNNGTANIANWDQTADPNFKLVVNSSREINTDITSSGTGVTTSEKDVINGGGYFMLIPTPGTAKATFKVTIDYDVETTDASLNGGKSTVNNVIWKNIEVGDNTNGFTNNKAYTLKLILGLTSVKLDAEVAEWEIEGDINVDLPRNQE